MALVFPLVPGSAGGRHDCESIRREDNNILRIFKKTEAINKFEAS